MKKGFAPTILIAVLALVLTVGGVGVLAWKTDYLDKWLPASVKEMFGRGEKPVEEVGEEDQPEADEEGTEEEPEEDLTKDWKTYTNTKHKYQFKVPKDFEVQAYALGPEVDSSTADSISFEGESGLAYYIYYMPDGPFYNPPSGTDLIGWLKKWEFQPPEKPNLEIDGIPAVKIYEPGLPGMVAPMDEIYFIRGGKLFKIQMDVLDEQDREFNSLVLSTFKFIE